MAFAFLKYSYTFAVPIFVQCSKVLSEKHKQGFLAIFSNEIFFEMFAFFLFFSFSTAFWQLYCIAWNFMFFYYHGFKIQTCTQSPEWLVSCTCNVTTYLQFLVLKDCSFVFFNKRYLFEQDLRIQLTKTPSALMFCRNCRLSICISFGSPSFLQSTTIF